VTITNKEKTIVDCLDKPKYGGGIVEAAKALKEKNLDFKRIADYARNMNNSAVTRRLGYLCEQLNIPINLPTKEIKIYLNKVRNYLPLDPTMPKEGHLDSTWQLIINWEEL
jgi:predicted transcriptional regulator of viral defense system